MGATKEDLFALTLFYKAVFPVAQVLLDDDPKIRGSFEEVRGTVQIGAKDDGRLIACHMDFDGPNLTVVQGPAENPDVTLTFGTVQKCNTMFRGGMALPGIRFKKLGLLLKTLGLLMGLKIMLPSSKPKTDAQKALKVKMSLYMVTRALSVSNKEGDPAMAAWTANQPDRIYQFLVEPYDETRIACYLRVKAGKTKSGHGIYERRTPFVLFHFFGLDGALKVLGKEVAFVEGCEKGCVETIGSPEYACQLNDFMAVIQGMLT